MKKQFFTILFILVSFCLYAQHLPTVAVAEFDVSGGVTKDEAQVVTELFMTELVSTGAFNVVDRNNFDRIMKEMKFQSSDWSSNNRTIEFGRALNAGYIIRGQLMKMGSKIYWTATMIDANTAQVLSSAREQFDDFDNIFKRLPTFCQQIVSKLPSPNYLIGRWQSTYSGQVLILEFKSDMSIIVERFEVKTSDFYPADGRRVNRSYNGKGTGIYSYDSNQISISLNLDFPQSNNDDPSSSFKRNNNVWTYKELPYNFFNNNNGFNFTNDRGILAYYSSDSQVFYYYNSFIRLK